MIDCTLPAATWRRSPNFGERKSSGEPDMLILHYTGMPTGKAALDWLCNPASEVSAHYFVEEDGAIVQSVQEKCRAWHAGRSFWQGDTDINSRSIGIEIVNPGPDGGYPDFPDRQIAAVIALCRDILSRHRIPAAHILAHSDVAPGRKIDPGEKFPWHRLAAEGVGLWIEPSPVSGGRFFQEGDAGEPVQALQAMFGHFGYDVELSGVFDAKTAQVVAAFQRHFRPARVDGIADTSTLETLHRLLTAASSR